jgi:choline dehydrogenase-like flavoprotein
VQDNRKFDAVVVGSGAAGGWAAKELTERGMRVILLDAGPLMGAPAVPSEASEQTCGVSECSDATPSRQAQPIQSTCYVYAPDTRHLFVDDVANPYTTPDGLPFVWIRGRQVGGRTLTWAGHSYRMSDYEFKAASRDGYGDDWPICYADLAPYYDLVESVSNVCGSIEGLSNLPDGCFTSPMPLSNAELHFQKAITSKWTDRRVIPARRAMYNHPGKPGPQRNAVHKYSTSASSTLPPALKTGRLTILANSVVSHVIANESTGLAEGVACVDRVTKRASEIFARVVVLCASTIETTRILLNSRSRRHPHGIANSTGLVGHYLMDHLMLGFYGVIRYSSSNGQDKSEHDASNGVYIPRFQNLTSTDHGFLRGYAIQAKTIAAYSTASDPGTHEGRGKQASHLYLDAFGEMLPRRENRITLDASVKDAWGIPAAHIECSHSDNDVAIASAATEAILDMAVAADIEWIRTPSRLSDPGTAVHEVGTVRMGDHPRNSVLNAFNQSWDVSNLFVTDGACFPSQGVQNPTLTIMALTARACAYIAEQCRRGQL